MSERKAKWIMRAVWFLIPLLIWAYMVSTQGNDPSGEYCTETAGVLSCG
jgi:hypothetical protein